VLASSFLLQNALDSGVDLDTATDKVKLAIYRRTLDAIRKLPDKVDMRTIGIEVLNVLELDLREIINGLDMMGMAPDGTARANSMEGILANTRQARLELSVASDMLRRDDCDSAAARRDFYASIVNWQGYLAEALKYF
jgi:hypothetical protein